MNRGFAIMMSGVAALAGATIVAVPSLASVTSHHTREAGSKEHTLSFFDKKAGKALDKGPVLLQADDDYHGKTLIGTDTISCTFGKTAGHCLVALSVKGGMLYGTFTETPSDTITGKITGGAGVDKGASGTIASKAHQPIVVTYRH